MEVDDATPQLENMFELAVEHMRNQETCPPDKLLQLYGLYKHITVGKCTSTKPTKISSHGKSKFEAWKACKELSVGQAMDRYVKIVSSVYPGFSNATLETSELDEAEEKAVADLNSLPAPSPPKSIGRYLRSKNGSASNAFLDMQKRSGFDPMNEAYDHQDRIELHERLIKFYRAVHPKRLVEGIGELVDFGLQEGETKLNQRLKREYSVSLTELEEKQARRTSESNKKKKAPPPNSVFENAQFKNLTVEQAQVLSKKIERFFYIFDPEKIERGIDTGFIELIYYIDRRGEESLNKRLVKKYGKSLTDLDVDEVDGGDFGDSSMQLNKVGLEALNSKSSFINVLPKRSDSSFASSNKIDIDQLHQETSMSTVQRKRSKSEEIATRHQVSRIELPAYVKPALVSFYIRYEPAKLNNGSVKKVYAWAKRNGLRKLNRELKRRYNQSLDEFVDDSDKLKAELIAFYKKIDESKIGDGLDKIHSWGIKNGRNALNQKLRKKYNFDLDTYQDDSRKPSDKSINF